MKKLLVLTATLFAAPVFATDKPFDIVIKSVSGTGCPDPSVFSVEVDPASGDYNLVAEFNQNGDVFVANSSVSETNKRVNCTIDYDLKLAPQYKLDIAQFELDGQYNLSETGTAFFSIRHAVPGLANASIQSVTKKYDTDDADGNWRLSGYIEGIDERVNVCGGTIPLQVQIRATARQSSIDSLDTFVTVDNAEGDVHAQRGKKKIKCNAKPVWCY
ncbi:MAG: DUF4360 domain-containing protein [Proteobacteria bacterium]|nr:MAG: DUF4360 domain-containing protein [Pseudomonadota bacterium]